MLLGVNIDHVATLRQSRGTRYPDPVQAALTAEQAGADSITVHLREDRRHIQERDVFLLKEVMSTPLNLELAVTEEMIGIAERLKPRFCCLVPERREELTTEGGLDVASAKDRVRSACKRLSDAGIRVALFIDADAKQISAAAACGATAIEIHTGHYADTDDAQDRGLELQRIIEAVRTGNEARLLVNAGHGLNYQNVGSIAGISGIGELNIGHSIVARAVFTGLTEAVREMKRLVCEAANQ